MMADYASDLTSYAGIGILARLAYRILRGARDSRRWF